MVVAFVYIVFLCTPSPELLGLVPGSFSRRPRTHLAFKVYCKAEGHTHTIPRCFPCVMDDHDANWDGTAGPKVRSETFFLRCIPTIAFSFVPQPASGFGAACDFSTMALNLFSPCCRWFMVKWAFVYNISPGYGAMERQEDTQRIEGTPPEQVSSFPKLSFKTLDTNAE